MKLLSSGQPYRKAGEDMTRGGKVKLGRDRERLALKAARAAAKVLRSKTWARKAPSKGLPEDRANALAQELTRRARSEAPTRTTTGSTATPEEARARREARRSS